MKLLLLIKKFRLRAMLCLPNFMALSLDRMTSGALWLVVKNVYRPLLDGYLDKYGRVGKFVNFVRI